MVIWKPGELDWNYSFIIHARLITFFEDFCNAIENYLSKFHSWAPQRNGHPPHLDNYESSEHWLIFFFPVGI